MSVSIRIPRSTRCEAGKGLVERRKAVVGATNQSVASSGCVDPEEPTNSERGGEPGDWFATALVAQASGGTIHTPVHGGFGREGTGTRLLVGDSGWLSASADWGVNLL